MVMRPWLDLVPASTQQELLQRPDRAITGEILDVLDGGMVEVQIEGSEEPTVVAPVESGVTAVGAQVRLLRDSSGRVVQVSAPMAIPDGATTVTVGATGALLDELAAADERMQAAQDSLIEAEAERAAAMDALEDRLAAAAEDQNVTEAILADLNDVVLPALDEKLDELGDLDGIQEEIEDALAQLDNVGHVITEGPPPTTPVIGKTIWVAPNGVQYRAVKCKES